MRLRGFKVWQRANYESFAGKMLRRRNLNDSSRCRNDANRRGQRAADVETAKPHRHQQMSARKP